MPMKMNANMIQGLMFVAAQDLAPQISFVKIFAYVVLGCCCAGRQFLNLDVKLSIPWRL
jgi:hypothetical protein